MASKFIIDTISAYIEATMAPTPFVENRIYAESVKPPLNVDEYISARFPGTARMRSEVGGDPAAMQNAYFEDGSFRIDLYVRIKSVNASGAANQDRLHALRESVVTAFLGKTISNIEIFRVATGLDVPAGAPQGWWTESISCGFHYEHFGP